MTLRRLSARAFIAAIVMVVAGPALVGAQTSAVGPYYAEPAWDQKLPTSTRFIVLSNWDSQAVLDRETGLVWERTPAGSISDWFVANSGCIIKTVGGRMGWQLPTIQQLASLVDPSVPAPGPRLPTGHPFIGVSAGGFWSATSQTPSGTNAWLMDFSSGSVGFNAKGTFFKQSWCVRGGQAVDPQ